jgi:hypothetical protein
VALAGLGTLGDDLHSHPADGARNQKFVRRAEVGTPPDVGVGRAFEE